MGTAVGPSDCWSLKKWRLGLGSLRLKVLKEVERNIDFLASSANMDDEDDPIVQEIDVYLTQVMADDM
jgi:hypothetical protein